MPGPNEITFFLILAISVLTGVVFEAPPQLTKKQVLRAIHANATSRPLSSHLSVAVGTNVCVDLIVDAEAFFSAAGASLPKHTAAALADAPASSSVSSEQDLVNVFSHFFNRGAAAERFVDPALFEKLVATAEGLSSTEPRLGGNAALIGNVLARQGHSVAMVAPDGPTLRALVHDRVRLVGATAAAVEKHIILEYGVGATFQGLNSDRANRVILTPAGAPSVHALDDFAGLLSETAADKAVDAVVVSGLHLLEPTSREEWGPYLEKAHTALASGVASRPQHLELASLSNQQLTLDIVRTLFPVASSVGFNEEELGALFSALGGGYDDLPRKQCDPQRDAEAKRHRILRWNIVKRAIKLLQLESLLDELDPPEVPPCLLGKSPDVAAVSAALDYVFRAAHAQGSSVSRLHFHSLGFHIIATARRGITGTGTNTGADGGGSAGHLPLREWPNVLQAAASGALAATYQACNVSGHEDLHGDDLELVVPTKLDVHATGDDVRSLGKEEALHLWQTAYLDVAFSPVLVCKKPLVTVGLGDAISAKALAAHF